MYSLFQKIPYFVKKLQKFLIYICLFLLGTRCAQITPLSGGKKDNDAPKAINYYPVNASLNFSKKVIEVQFDEYIVIKDIANQFIITPQTKETPDIQAMGKKLRITFNEPLLPNTTYKLAFGNAISDLNESNVIQNFEYIFSTGPTLDSLQLNGQVLSAVNQKAVSQSLIGLYNMKANDSIIYKEKPLYITKSDEAGKFSFNYLPNSLFKIIAIRDQNKNLVYDGSDEEIAFTKDLVNTQDSNFISLVMFKEVPSKNFIKRSYSPEYGKGHIIFNKPQLDIKEVRGVGLIDYYQSITKDTLTLYYANKFDTLETFIKYESRKEDTVYIKINNKDAFAKQIKSNGLKYIVRASFSQTLPFYELPVFELNTPFDFKNLNEDRMTLIEKTDSGSKVVSSTIINDKGWITSFKIQYAFKPETNYTVIFNKSFMQNDEQRINDSVTFQFKTTVVDDYAQLKLKLFFPKKENYIVFLLNDKEQIINQKQVELSLTSASEKIIEYKNLIPGSYLLRIVEDANKNGLFDMGNYFLKQQPEIIFVNPTPIKLLAGWEIENEWIVK